MAPFFAHLKGASLSRLKHSPTRSLTNLTLVAASLLVHGCKPPAAQSSNVASFEGTDNGVGYGLTMINVRRLDSVDDSTVLSLAECKADSNLPASAAIQRLEAIAAQMRLFVDDKGNFVATFSSSVEPQKLDMACYPLGSRLVTRQVALAAFSGVSSMLSLNKREGNEAELGSASYALAQTLFLALRLPEKNTASALLSGLLNEAIARREFDKTGNAEDIKNLEAVFAKGDELFNPCAKTPAHGHIKELRDLNFECVAGKFRPGGKDGQSYRALTTKVAGMVGALHKLTYQTSSRDPDGSIDRQTSLISDGPAHRQSGLSLAGPNRKKASDGSTYYAPTPYSMSALIQDGNGIPGYRFKSGDSTYNVGAVRTKSGKFVPNLSDPDLASFNNAISGAQRKNLELLGRPIHEISDTQRQEMLRQANAQEATLIKMAGGNSASARKMFGPAMGLCDKVQAETYLTQDATCSGPGTNSVGSITPETQGTPGPLGDLPSNTPEGTAGVGTVNSGDFIDGTVAPGAVEPAQNPDSDLNGAAGAIEPLSDLE